MSCLSIVVPVYHNSQSLPALVKRLSKIAEKEFQGDLFELIFVDDGSGDNSFEVLTKLSQEDSRICIVRLSRNFGSNAAILAGLSCAKGDAVVVISADLQDPPELIPEMVQAWMDGNQVVLAARNKRKDPLVSKLSSAITNRMLRLLVFPDYPPNGFDFMLLDHRVVEIIVSMKEMNAYIFGLAMWVGFQRKVIFYDRVAREHGRSRWTLSKKIKYFVDIFVAFSFLPLRIASVTGLFFAFLGFLYATVLIGMRVFSAIPIPGWTTLIVVVLFSSGLQLLLLGVLGEYMWRALDESRNRPPFIVAEMKNVKNVVREYKNAWPNKIFKI